MIPSWFPESENSLQINTEPNVCFIRNSFLQIPSQETDIIRK